MSKLYGKELDNKFLLRENYLKEEFFQDAVKDKVEEFKRRYPEAEIVKKTNKSGARVIVYSKS